MSVWWCRRGPCSPPCGSERSVKVNEQEGDRTVVGRDKRLIHPDGGGSE